MPSTLTRVPVMRLGGIDDPIWKEGVAPPGPPAQPSLIKPLAVVVGGSLLLTISVLCMPWFGLDQNLGRWNLMPTWTPVDAVPQASSSGAYGPGTQRFGDFLLFAACAMVVLALATMYLVRWHSKDRTSLARMGLWSVVIAAACSLVLVILEASASPPFGDGPNLSLDWGTVVGLLAVSITVLGAIWCLGASRVLDK